MQQTTDGGYIIGGYTGSFGAGSNDFYLLRTNNTGDTLWTKTFGGTGDDGGYSVQATADGGFIVVGITSSFGAGEYDVYLIKTDTNGDTLWTKTYGDNGSEYGYSVNQTADGGYIITGVTDNYCPTTCVLLIKTDSTGYAPIGINYLNPAVNESIKVYPNPAGNVFYIRGSYALPAVLELYDITGRKIIREPIIKNLQQIDVSKLAGGVYFFSVTGNNSLIGSGKIIIR